MRVIVMAGLVGAALAAPADACPQGARCIAMLSGPTELTSIRSFETPAAPRAVRDVKLTMRFSGTVQADGYARLHSSLRSFEPPVPSTDGVEMPWIWEVLASEVHDRLPRYEQADQFSMVLSPVVVSMPSESTPGIGLSGDF